MTKKEAPRLMVGDMVEWTSQANGARTTKRGVVERVLSPGERPKEGEISAPGFGRVRESYMVRANGKLYWPRELMLRHIKKEAPGE